VPAGRRRNPARGAKVVALVSSLATTLGLAGALDRADGGGEVVPAGAATATGRARAVAASPTTAPAATTRRNASGLADGVYTGTAEPTKWGPIQVQVTIRSGRIVAVEEVLAPGNRKSIANKIRRASWRERGAKQK
jgi:hypothetical protein